MLEISLILVFYVLAAFLAKQQLWGAVDGRINKTTSRFYKCAFLSAWFTPSVFLSSHAAIPLPAILALIAGVTYSSPSFSIWFSFGLFLLVFLIGMVSCYLFYYLKYGRSSNAI